MPTTSNFGWTTPADTDLVKDGAAAIRTLGNGIDTSFLDLKGGTTDQVLAKNSNTDLDFKWVAQDDSNAIQNAIVDAKGDLISATAADTPARLAVGTDGQYLQADSSTATGLKWAGISAGGMTLLSTTSLSGSTQVTISNISQSYVNLLILINNAVKPNGTGDQAYTIEPNATTNAAGTVREANTGDSFQADSVKFAASSPQTDQPRSYFLTINNYASTTAYKTFAGGGIQRRADNAAWEGTSTTGGLQSNSAVTSIVFSSGATNFSGGEILIYGVK